MTDQEPDGTPGYAASLEAPGNQVRPGTPPEVTDDDIAPDPAPAGDDASLEETAGGAGYDASAVSGDTEVYRPE